MPLPPEEREKIKRKWMRKWNDAKDDIVETLSDPETQTKWKRRVLDPNVVKERREKLIEAINAGLIEAGLEEVDPAEWASETIEGLQSKTVDETDAEEFIDKADEYIAFVKEKKKELERLGYTGKKAYDWWWANVLEPLKRMKLQKGKKFAGRRVEIVEVA